MGNFTLYGILLIVGLFLFLAGFVCSQIGVENPFTGAESSVLEVILGWIIH